MKKLIVLLLFCGVTAQSQEDITMSLEEYLGYVKTFHPIVKQANLITNEADAISLGAKGAFDPSVKLKYDNKDFGDKEYYDKLYATLKVPAWYGIDVKANYENNSGYYLNPESNTPDNGLYSVGVSVSLAQDLLINERRATLKKAKNYQKQAEAERILEVNQILYNASLTYFKWLKCFNEKEVHKNFLKNTETRFYGIKKSFITGEKPAIDTLEAKIAVDNRKLNLEKAQIKLIKSSLELSNFLWSENNTPLEVQENTIPDIYTNDLIDIVLKISTTEVDSFAIAKHPKLNAMNYKLENLNIDQKLKTNKLLPKINYQYNFLSQSPEKINTFSTSNYKQGLYVSMPLFLRKERADLKLSKLKLNNLEYDLANTKLSLTNKIDATQKEISSLKRQTEYSNTMVIDYEKLLKAEERKFFLGESSLFIVNSRESKLIDLKLKAIQVTNEHQISKAKLFNILATQY